MPKIEERIDKLINKAVYDYKMIENGDRVLVGFSGGKDSITALHWLKERQKRKPDLNFELAAVHIITDISEASHKDEIIKFLEQWEVKYHILKVDVISTVYEGFDFNCYWCAKRRRMHILKLANDMGYNKIVLGHNQDDIIETFLMNIFYKAETTTMRVVHNYERFPYSIIRPLCLVKEEMIEKFVKKMNYPIVSQSCPYSDKTKREEVRKIIEEVSKNDKSVRDRIFTAIKNAKEESLRLY